MNGNPTYDELMAANRELQKRVERLEGAFQLNHTNGMQIKSRFLSNITHEIRTPMNAILGFSGLLQNEGLTQNEQEEYLFYINHNSQALLKVMDNIIDLTLLETENLKLNREEVSIQDLITDVYEYHNMEMARSEGARVAILMSMPDNESQVIVTADSYRLRRVMDNLVSCALKYQKKGVVELKLEIPENDRVVFSVNCEENAQLAKRAKVIFEKNGNDDDWADQLDNTGVACKLARDLVEAMDGSVSLCGSKEEDRINLRVELPIHHIEHTGLRGAAIEKMDTDEVPAFNSN